jgi:hypothetical protein
LQRGLLPSCPYSNRIRMTRLLLSGTHGSNAAISLQM